VLGKFFLGVKIQTGSWVKTSIFFFSPSSKIFFSSNENEYSPKIIQSFIGKKFIMVACGSRHSLAVQVI
jgi:hypothetical protein